MFFPEHVFQFSFSLIHTYGHVHTHIHLKDRMGVLIMLAGDSTGSGWDYWFEYVATSERIQWCKFNFCLLNCIFVEFGEIDIYFLESLHQCMITFHYYDWDWQWEEMVKKILDQILQLPTGSQWLMILLYLELHIYKILISLTWLFDAYGKTFM